MTPFEITKVAIACVAFLLFSVLSYVFMVNATRALNESFSKFFAYHVLAVSSLILMRLSIDVIVKLL